MIAEVVVDISNDSVDRVYDYFALPTTQVGMRVRVPFANRLVLGYVLRIKEDTDFDKSKLKTIKENLDDLPLIKPELVKLADFMSSRFFLRKADIFKLILPASIRQGHDLRCWWLQHPEVPFQNQSHCSQTESINTFPQQGS